MWDLWFAQSTSHGPSKGGRGTAALGPETVQVMEKLEGCGSDGVTSRLPATLDAA